MSTPADASPATPEAATPRPVLPLLAVAVTLVLWASAFVAIRHLADVFDPGALSLGRLVVGSVALGVVLLARGGRRPARRDWPPLIGIGVLWFGLYNVALNAGERMVDAGTAALLIQLSPVLVAILAAVFLGERATLWLGLGIVVALSGVVLIATAAGSDGGSDPLGVLLCLTSAAAYAVSLVLQKTLASRLSALQIVWTACTVGALACLPYSGRLVADVADASTADLGWVVYLGLFPTAVAFTTYAYALGHMSAGNLAVSTYLVPPLTVLMSALVLAEAPPPLAYAGGVLCLAGVAITRRRPRAAPAAPSAAPPAAPSTAPPAPPQTSSL